MRHPLHRVVHFDLTGPTSLRVQFEDESEQTIDFLPVLYGEIYRPLRDPEMFRQVRIDPIAHTLVWPNGADFDPATLHDWPKHQADFERMVRSWEPAQAR